MDRQIPRDLETIVLKATAKEPARRYATAAALAEDLRRFAADQPIQARRARLRERVWRWCRRNPAWSALTSCVVLMGLAIIIISSLSAMWLSKVATRAKEAEHEAKAELWQSKLNQIRAGRMSRQVGQRITSLQVVEEAVKLARELNLPEEREEQFLQLRNEAIACLALPDLRLAREWDTRPFGAYTVNFDDTLERYAGVNREGVISVCRVADNIEIHHLSGIKRDSNLILSPDGQFLAQRSGSWLKLWKLISPEPVLVKDLKDCSALAFSPDSRELAIGDTEGCISLYDLASDRRNQQLKVGVSTYHVAFNAKDRQLAIALPSAVQIRDLETGKVLAEFALEWNRWPYVTWHPDGKRLAAVGGDTNIYLWDVPSRKPVAKLEGHKGGGIYCLFNHSGDLLASTDWTGSMRLWDPRTAKQLFQTRAAMSTVRFSPDDRFLAGEIAGNKLRIWEVVASREYRTLARDLTRGQAGYQSCSLSSDGRLLAVGMDDGFGLWDLSSSKELAFMRTPGITHVLFEPGGALLTIGPGDVRRWPVRCDPASGGALHLGPPDQLPVPGSNCKLAQSRDGRVLACPHWGGAYVMFAERSEQPVKIDGHEDVRSVAVSPDGRWVATGSHGSSAFVKVWEAATAKHVKDLLTGGGTAVAFSPDGKWLATTGDGIRVWSTGTWKERFCLEGQFRVCVAFSPDSHMLAFETNCGVIRLVHPDTGYEIARLEDPEHDRAGYITFSTDGTQLVATTNDSQSIHIWDLRGISRQLAEMRLD
jgi:WD40 repeat protein